MTPRISLALFLVWLALIASGCARSESASQADAAQAGDGAKLIPVTLQLNWYPEAEHGGFYAALAEGYYREAGLDVSILPGGPETPVVQQVARRAATFGVVNADGVLFGRAQQAPVVALMAPLQNSPRCIMVHAGEGIRGFDDLKNMTIAMSNSNAYSQWLRKKLPLEGVRIVPYPGNVAQFLLNKNYAQQGYVFSEPYLARKEGGDPQVLMVSDLGFNPYTSLLIAHESLVTEQPDLARKMVEASARGWAHYLQSPTSANQRIHQANPQMDLEILAYGAETMKPLVLTADSEARGIGTMSLARWKTLAEQLIESDQLKPDAVDVERAFTDRFLPARN